MVSDWLIGMLVAWLGWGKALLITVCSLLFLSMGIDMLVASYRVANPLYFIMTFFSSSLIIMISIAGLLFAAIRLYYHFKQKR